MKRRTKNINALAMPVQKKRCKTCPFGGREPVDLHPKALIEYTHNIVTLQSQHLCHNAENKMLCRGGRELMLRVLYNLPLIDTPTDEAFDQRSRQVLAGRLR